MKNFQDFLSTICPGTLCFFTLIYFLFIFLLIYRYNKSNHISYLLTSLLTFGLFYDSLILCFGIYIEKSPLLKLLSQYRFIFHFALIPSLYPITAHTVFPNKKIIKIILWTFAIFQIVIGIPTGFITQLEFKYVGNVSRYTVNMKLMPKWAQISYIFSFFGVVPLIIGGIYDLVKNKSGYFLLSGLIALVFSAVAPGLGVKDMIFFVSSFGEFFMVPFLYLSIYGKEKEQQKEKNINEKRKEE